MQHVNQRRRQFRSPAGMATQSTCNVYSMRCTQSAPATLPCLAFQASTSPYTRAMKSRRTAMPL